MIRPHPTYLRSQRKQEYGSNYDFSQFSSKNYILLSVGTPDLSDTSLVAEVPRNPAPLRRCGKVLTVMEKWLGSTCLFATILPFFIDLL